MQKVLTFTGAEDTELQKLNNQFNDSIEVLRWAFKEYDKNILYACSFGAEGIVMLDLISKVNKSAKVVFLDTELHFKETYELIEKIKEKYPELQIELVIPKLDLKKQEDMYGPNLWSTNPDLCCQLRKIEPLDHQLAKVSAWISGLRREQSTTRKHLQFINKDERFKKIKICPLIHWTWEEIWNYIQLHHLPYNTLHDQGYPSIGCDKCTSQIKEGNGLRSGRWASQNKTECGLHKP